MKKIILFIILLSCGLVLMVYLKKTYKPEEINEAVYEKDITLSEDDSLEAIENELEATEVEDFETDLNELDKEINQL